MRKKFAQREEEQRRKSARGRHHSVKLSWMKMRTNMCMKMTSSAFSLFGLFMCALKTFSKRWTAVVMKIMMGGRKKRLCGSNSACWWLRPTRPLARTMNRGDADFLSSGIEKLIKRHRDGEVKEMGG